MSITPTPGARARTPPTASGPDTRSGPSPTEDCGNGVDDDGDGRVDCEDADCATARVCQEGCDDGFDDDGDGLVDCDDDDCWGFCTEVRMAITDSGPARMRLVEDEIRWWSIPVTTSTRRSWSMDVDPVAGTLATRRPDGTVWQSCT